jgi:hypothetical protein
MSVTNKRSYFREERVSNASIKKKLLYYVCLLAWNNRLLELTVDFLQHITMVVRRRKVADNSSKPVLLEKQH